MTILNNSLENKLFKSYFSQAKENNCPSSIPSSGGFDESKYQARPSLENLKANFLAFKSRKITQQPPAEQEYKEIKLDVKAPHSGDYLKAVDYRFQDTIAKAATYAINSKSQELTGVYLLAALIDDALSYLNNPDQYSYKPALIKEIEKVNPEILSNPQGKAIVYATLEPTLQVFVESAPMKPRTTSSNELLLEEDFDKTLSATLQEMNAKSKLKIYPTDGVILETIKRMPDNVLSKASFNLITGSLAGKNIDAKTAAGINSPLIPGTELADKLETSEIDFSKLPRIKSYSTTAKFIGSLVSNNNNRIMLVNDKGSVSRLVMHELEDQIKSNSFHKLDPEKTDIVVVSAEDMLDVPKIFDDLRDKALQDPSKKIILFIKDFEQIISNFLYDVAGSSDSGDTKGVIFDSIIETIPIENFSIVGMTNSETYNEIMGSQNEVDSTIFALKTDLQSFSPVKVPQIGTNECITFIKELIKNNPKEFKNKFSEEAIKEAVYLSVTMQNSYPGKALNIINLMDSCLTPETKKIITKKDVINFVNQFRSFLDAPKLNLTEFYPASKSKLKDYILTPKALDQVREFIDHINDSKAKRSISSNNIWNKTIISGSTEEDRLKLVQTIATETKLPVLTVKTPKIINYFYNNTEIPLTIVFRNLKMIAEDNPNKTAILHIEDIEALAGFYNNELTDTHQKVGINKLFDEVENLRKQGLNIIVLGTTASTDQLNDQLYKAGGFKEEISIPTPAFDKEFRNKIICSYVKEHKINFAQDSIDLKDFLADISYGCDKEAIFNIIDRAKEIANTQSRKEISRNDIKEAFARTATGHIKDININNTDKDLLIVHEVGHYLTNLIMYDIAKETNQSWKLPNKSSLIDINTRKDYLGATFMINDGYNGRSLESTFAGLVCDFGGEAGESTVHNISSSYGIGSDLRAATMDSLINIIFLGMGDSSGRIALDYHLLPEQEKQKIIDKAKLWTHNAQVASQMITVAYKDFLIDMMKEYSSKVGTGHIIDSEEFDKHFHKFLADNKSNPTFNQAITELKRRIPEMIIDTIQGRKTNTPKKEQRLAYEEELIRGK